MCDDMELVQQLRAKVAPPSVRATAAARQALNEAIEEERRQTAAQSSVSWRWPLAGVAATVIALLIVLLLYLHP